MLPLLVVAAAAASSASASSPLLVFDRPAAAPHEFVVAKTARKGSLRHVRRNTLRLSVGGVALGRLAVSRKGNGKLRFEVPNLPAGAYDVLLSGFRGRPHARTAGTLQVMTAPTRVRTCEQSVYGKVSDDDIDRSLHVGPLRFIGYDPAAASSAAWLEGLRNPRGEYAQKVLLLLERGAEATIAIAPADRRDIALFYFPSRLSADRVTDGDAAVGFAACAETESAQPYTQFNGGYIFRRALCAHISVSVAGRSEPIALALPFGKPCGVARRAAPRNGRIAFTRGNWIYTVAPGGGRPTKLVKGSDPAWAPDGGQLAFNRGDALYVSDANGQGVHKLAGDAIGPAWSPDGSRIAFAGYEYPFDDCIPTTSYAIVWTIAADGSDRRLFTPAAVARSICSLPGGDADPSWSPDGARIAVTHSALHVPTRFDNTVIVAPTSGKPRKAVRAGFAPDWSPTGGLIAWVRSYRGASNIFVGPPTASSKSRRLVRGSTPEWSPDGAKIVFSAGGRLKVFDVKTGAVRRLSVGPNDRSPSWAQR
jgi:hypothetical protein